MLRAGLPGLAAALVVVASTAASATARAQDGRPPEASAPAPAPNAPPPNDVARSRASEVFEAARRLFEAGDFSAAAQSFEEAYALAPHHSASWNAARSWHKAGDLPHAAMLYQRYLREAPWDAPDRDEAGRSLTEIRPSLGRIQIVPPGTKGVTVDGRPLEYDEIWVVPGAHLVESAPAGRPTVTKVDVVAGAIVSVAIAPSADGPGPSTPSPPPTPAHAARRGAEPAHGGDGWPTWTILPFAGATLAAAGCMVASGIDTESLHDEFEESDKTSGYAYDNGKFAMNRTNVLVAVTSGLGAITLGVALFAIDWNGDAEGGRVVGRATPRGLDARLAF